MVDITLKTEDEIILAFDVSDEALEIASAETVTMTNTPTDQLDNKEARKEGAAYNGNWGYTPGNGLDDEWGRKSGVLDANSPGCPFKMC